MKKLLALLICILVVLCVPVTVFATEETTTTISTTQDPPVEDVPSNDSEAPAGATPEVVPESTPEVVPEVTPEESDGFSWEEVKTTVTGHISAWIEKNPLDIGIILAILGFIIDNVRSKKNLNKSMSIMNNNAITISKEGTAYMEKAVEIMQESTAKVIEYSEHIKTLETRLEEYKNYLDLSTEANLIFAKEMDELLLLANIPNCKKDEIGTRYAEAVAALNEAKNKFLNVEEVKEDDKTEET